MVIPSYPNTTIRSVFCYQGKIKFVPLWLLDKERYSFCAPSRFKLRELVLRNHTEVVR
jgi:hypothetical protein